MKFHYFLWLTSLVMCNKTVAEIHRTMLFVALTEVRFLSLSYFCQDKLRSICDHVREKGVIDEMNVERNNINTTAANDIYL